VDQRDQIEPYPFALSDLSVPLDWDLTATIKEGGSSPVRSRVPVIAGDLRTGGRHRWRSSGLWSKEMPRRWAGGRGELKLIIWVLEVITTVISSSYHFYFVVVPREASNLSEVRFGDVAVLKQISVLHRKSLWKFLEYLLDLRFLVHMPQVISKLSLV
jgi:hypothetical protein